MTLPEDVILLAQQRITGYRLDYLVAGARIAELALSGQALGGEEGPRDVAKLASPRATEQLIVELGQQGYLREGIRRVMGIPLRHQFPDADISRERQAAERASHPADLRDEILAALLDPSRPSPHWTVEVTRAALAERDRRQKYIDIFR